MISKPDEYRHSYCLTHEVAYEVLDQTQKGSHAAQGILGTGRVVWLKEALPAESSASTVTVYAEGVGTLTVDASALASAGRGQ